MAVDAAGDVFIADSGKNEVLEVTSASKQLTIGSGLSNPESVAVDAAGDVFIADTGNSRVVEVPAVGHRKRSPSAFLPHTASRSTRWGIYSSRPDTRSWS